LSNRLSSPVTGFIARRRTFTQDSCSLSYSPPSSPTPRTRRDKSQLHAARVQRSGSRTTNTTFLLGLQIGKQSTNSRRFPPSASTPADALAAVEPPHDQKLTRMAFAEQQRWVTVQQKTFTKWYLCFKFLACSMLTSFFQAQHEDRGSKP
jgi:hypothetical protein